MPRYFSTLPTVPIPKTLLIVLAFSAVVLMKMSLISPTPSLNGLILKNVDGNGQGQAALSSYDVDGKHDHDHKIDANLNMKDNGDNDSVTHTENEGEEDLGEGLFDPIRMGDIHLKHRIVMCPLTRHRADERGVHRKGLGEVYYEQRASDGGLIITEGTVVAHEAGGEANVPGIYSAEQVDGWKSMTDKVHAKGGKIVCQLWALGRVADPSLVDIVYAPSKIPLIPPSPDNPSSAPDSESGKFEKSKAESKLKEMTQKDIDRFVAHFKQAARNAVKAGFDGIEVHAANGYLIDQFIQTNSNNRTDAYGGPSPLHRIQFLLDILESVSAVIPISRVGLRISPYSDFQGMRMVRPLDTFVPLLEEVLTRYPDLAYVHIIKGGEGDDIQPLRNVVSDLGRGTGVIVAGEYTPDKARRVVREKGGAVGFGRYFISNPDLPFRIANNLPLNEWDEDTFYTTEAEGYTE
ncbi:uncharacterized protein I303_107591 [Kwoniella dejecticola CBS 10117]|uniref:NADH:flavin oxidoreductase/NADH oxidase N-terminal domain-containing protein n=1 Tax=Kwoniella dejecticola CBS 10117 TaxID=1296121 RepID=A0A1A5ZV57_9TREE|nr:uncharacterized protein I303_07601 [Kwoniella dejecticola CBS 10117]OBR81691.1 hypothetical protein I303_07601 [Kwoniella dejecticola CBS 10117]